MKATDITIITLKASAVLATIIGMAMAGGTI